MAKPIQSVHFRGACLCAYETRCARKTEAPTRYLVSVALASIHSNAKPNSLISLFSAGFGGILLLRTATSERLRPMLKGLLQFLQPKTPNPLVELTRYGMAPGPRGAYGHPAPRGPGAIPPLSAHRER